MNDKNSVDIPVLVAEREPPLQSQGRTNKNKPAHVSESSSTSIWIVLLILILFVIALVGGYFLNKQQQVITSLTVKNSELSTQIQSLNNSLSASDTNKLSSDAEVRSQLALYDSEIRKLWDVSNKRNKEWIKENQSQLAQLTTQLEALAPIQENQKELVTSLQQVQNQQTKIQESLKEIDSLDAQLASSNATANQSLQQSADQLIGLSIAQEAIQDKQEEFDSQLSEFLLQMADVSQAIDAIDQHRVKLSADIAELRASQSPSIVNEPQENQQSNDNTLDIIDPNEF